MAADSAPEERPPHSCDTDNLEGAMELTDVHATLLGSIQSAGPKSTFHVVNELRSTHPQPG